MFTNFLFYVQINKCHQRIAFNSTNQIERNSGEGNLETNDPRLRPAI